MENPFQINELKHGGAFYAANVQTGGLIISRMQENEEFTMMAIIFTWSV